MKKKGGSIVIRVAIIFVLSAFATVCFNPLGFLDEDDIAGASGDGTGSVVVQVTAESSVSAARTVVADFAANVSAWTVSLVRTGGTGSVHSARSSTAKIVVDGLVPGTWTGTVTGANASGIVILSGTVTDVTVIINRTVSVSVPVSIAASVPGSLSLPVSFPASTGIDYASGSINGVTLTPAVSVAADPRTVTFSLGSIAAGRYNLAFTLRRGGSGGTVAGTFVEAVNVYPGMVSARWIAADGSLSAVRVIAAADLFSANAYLGGLAVSSGSIVFSSGNFAPSVSTAAAVVSFTPTGSVEGELIECSPDAVVWSVVQSGAATPAVAPPGTYRIRVTSPDRGTRNVYAIQINRSYTVSYRSNGTAPALHDVAVASGAAHTVLANTPGGTNFTAPALDGVTYRFTGWNTMPGGTGTAYAPGNSIPSVLSDLTLFAQWSSVGGTGPAGGLVFHDKGNYSAGWRYLEAQNPAAGADILAAATNGADAALGTLTAVGAGKANTRRFLASATGGAAFLCSASSYGGFDDWFLPSLEELNALRANLHVAYGIGNLNAGALYASSSESGLSSVWAQTIQAARLDAAVSKTGAASYYFRPVRAFAGASPTRLVLYDANGGTGNVTASGAFFYPSGTSVPVNGGSEITKAGESFNGWNDRINGFGTAYGADDTNALDDSIVLADDALLYAQWINAGMAPTIADIIDGGGSFLLPASCTVNDFAAIGDAVAAATGPVTLDMNPLVLDTFPTSAFNGCQRLASVTLPPALKVIGNNCFNGCTGLANVTTTGCTFTAVEVGAFSGCTALVSITLPSTVTRIMNNAFAGTGMATVGGTVTCRAATPPSLGSNAFDVNPPASLRIIVPAGTLAAYRAAPGWSGYADHITE